jgi:hypothetical protein
MLRCYHVQVLPPPKEVVITAIFYEATEDYEGIKTWLPGLPKQEIFWY